jgi:hypothetical protein
LIVCFLITACRDEGTVTWKRESRSPDGYWLAIAEGKQIGGLGGAASFTTVKLVRTSDPDDKPTEIINLASDKLEIAMNWQGGRRLDVSYFGKAEIYFQAIKFADVNISLQKFGG